MASKGRGCVAAGNQATGEAARVILAEGGNAFDAALAAVFAACVAEPVLCSMGGGGFMMARPAGGSPVVYDFFAHTPRRRVEDCDFHGVMANFGETRQEFHIGLGSVATPGMARGLFAVHGDLGRMPLARIAEPALALCRDGVVIDAMQAFIGTVVQPILLASPAARTVFEDPDRPGQLLGAGARQRLPGFGDFLESLVIEGADLYHRGEVARAMTGLCAQGGHLTMADLEHYQVFRRRPLTQDFLGLRLWTNPPPSTGGLLIAVLLKLMEPACIRPADRKSPQWMTALAGALLATDRARLAAQLQDREPEDWPGVLLNDAFLAEQARLALSAPPSTRGTTHLSVVDGAGNVAGVTLSNGEGCGHMVPGCGFMLNNMLGEDDLNPAGFGRWPTDTRMSSMMAPSLLDWPDGRFLLVGSGGSKRIRTALPQVMLNRAVHGMDLEDAVAAPRLHGEDGRLDLEPGHDDDVHAALGAMAEFRPWGGLNMFFGGVHGVEGRGGGDVTGAGDPRRGGVFLEA